MGKILALDIGGTNTRAALINEKYWIERDQINPTVTGDVDAFLQNVKNTIDQCLGDHLDEVTCFAMGVPGRVRYDGYIYALPNVHIKDVPLAEFLEKTYGKPAFVINDAEVAALAEANVGPFKGSKSLYFITISTGVGGALTRNGSLVSSSYEVGHTMTPYKGNVYEFEHLASGTGLVKLSELNGLVIKNSYEFFQLYLQGNPLAVSVYKVWIAMLAEFLTNIKKAFNPEVFTLTGGVMKSADLFFEDLRRACPACHLERCGCGQEAGLIGASVLGFQRAKDIK